MWYFTWILGLGFAVMLAILNALWLESQDERRKQASGTPD
ncbi:cytochrome bd-I oxidase subunit CydX [Undibacterium squillarum]